MTSEYKTIKTSYHYNIHCHHCITTENTVTDIAMIVRRRGVNEVHFYSNINIIPGRFWRSVNVKERR